MAVIPDDGVGREVTKEAMKILHTVADKYGFASKIENFPWGCDYYLKHHEIYLEYILNILKDFDAIFLGCIGDARNVPDHISLTLLLKIHKGFEQYVNLRPIKLYHGVETPIKKITPETVDIIIIRENTEGEYSGIGGFFRLGTPDAVALQTRIFSWKGCERVMRNAFDLVRRRKKFENRPLWVW